MKKLLVWTSIVWLLAFMGWTGFAAFAAFCALAHAFLIALSSLARDRECSMCGKPYDRGVLGMHESCARSTRLVR